MRKGENCYFRNIVILFLHLLD